MDTNEDKRKIAIETFEYFLSKAKEYNDNIAYIKQESKTKIYTIIEELQNHRVTGESYLTEKGKYDSRVLELFVHLGLRTDNSNTFEYLLLGDVRAYLKKYELMGGIDQQDELNSIGLKPYMMRKLEEGIFAKNGGKKSKKLPKKEILGKLRCIYKIPGDRKEYLKHKGKLITVKKYKELMKAKSKKVKDKKTKPKKKELMKAKSKK